MERWVGDQTQGNPLPAGSECSTRLEARARRIGAGIAALVVKAPGHSEIEAWLCSLFDARPRIDPYGVRVGRAI